MLFLKNRFKMQQQYRRMDCISLFAELWQEWINIKLYLMAKGTSLLEKGYKSVLESLSINTKVMYFPAAFFSFCESSHFYKRQDFEVNLLLWNLNPPYL